MEKQEIKFSSSNIIFMIKMVWRACPQRVILIFCERLVGAGFYAFFALYLTRTLLNAIQLGKGMDSIIPLLILSLLVGAVGGGIFNFAYNYYHKISDQKIIAYFSKAVYDAALRADYECFENPEFYENYTKAAAQMNKLGIKLINNLGTIFGSTIQLAVSIIFLVYYDAWLIPVMLLPGIITFFIDKKFNKAKFDREMAYVPFNRKIEYVKRTVYLKDFSKEIRLSNIFEIMFDRFQTNIDEIISVSKSKSPGVAKWRAAREIMLDVGMNIGVISVIVWRFLVMNSYLIGDFAAVINMTGSTMTSMRRLMSHTIFLYEHNYFISNLRNFLENKPEICDIENAKDAPKTPVVISAENLSFTYKGQSAPVFKNLNFEIAPKEKIAIVGHNGAGKSTLVKLLLRLYDADSGEIKADNTNIKNYKIAGYRNMFATVFQDFQIFGMTVAENVLQREIKGEEDKENAKLALSQSGLLDKVLSYNKGVDTQLTREFDREGAVMSGGEFQKLAVARVFAKNCPVAILDEPSSALDPISEYKIFDSMMKACKDKTVIFISHRLSSSVLADRIFLLENGEIAETGSHKQLMKLKGKYAKMFKMQAEKYVDSEVAL